MSREDDRLAQSVDKMTESVNGMKEEFAGMRVQHAAVRSSVQTLTGKVETMNDNVIRLEGRQKGLRGDVQRIEETFNTKLKEDIPTIVRAELGVHAARPVAQPVAQLAAVGDPSHAVVDTGGFKIPKWVVYAGLFLGAAAVGAGFFISKVF